MAASKNQRWMIDSGILRKKNGDEEPQELLVFGYSCKLFRDDDKAKMIDQGKHLIPWMGDSTLKIDRYDGRGALGDIRTYEPPTGGFDQRTILTEDELKIEQMCDEERYRSLYNNDAEESTYHEEEMKRLHRALDLESTYNQVAYSYNDEENGSKVAGEDSQSPKRSEGSQEEDQVFVPPAELELPEGIVLPETQKLNAIITKTALFISRQGGQMEILIKAKQANNPQFSFLSIDGRLHRYYRHVLEAIKSGKYNPEKQPEKEESEPEEGSSDQDDESYLHPSLAPSFTKIEAAPSIPSIQYKPSADCAYSMLVNKITGKPPPSRTTQSSEASIQPMTAQPSGYYEPASGQGYNAYSAPIQYSHGPVIYGPNGQVRSPPRQTVVSVPPPPPPPPPVPTPTPTPSTVPSASSLSVSLSSSAEVTTIQTGNSSDQPSMPLVPYGSSSQKPLSRPSFIVPPADVQIIIDKMASYVAKNGRDFESIVKNKGDPRFNFLELSHQYHGYYAHKLTIYEGAVNAKVLTEEELLQRQEPQEEKQKKLEELQKKQQRMEEVQKRVKMIQAKKKCDARTKPGSGAKQQITTVSFSIKKPKDGEALIIEKRSALPVEESDEEMENENRERNSKPNSPQYYGEQSSVSVVTVGGGGGGDSAGGGGGCDGGIGAGTGLTLGGCIGVGVGGDFGVGVNTMGSNSTDREHKRRRKEERELVDLTDDILEDCQKEIRHKQSEERIKDKLVAAARDKLAATSKERQLQLERKKKAAMFLSQIQQITSVGSSKTMAVGGSIVAGHNARRDDSDEVHSVPSPSPSSLARSPSISISVSPSASPSLSVCLDEQTARTERPEDSKVAGNSLMERLKGVESSGKRPRQKSRSPTGERYDRSTDRQRFRKKHKKKKSSRGSGRDSPSASRSHRSKKSKKSSSSSSSSKHGSRSRTPSRRHRHRGPPHRRGSDSSYSDSSSP